MADIILNIFRQGYGGRESQSDTIVVEDMKAAELRMNNAIGDFMRSGKEEYFAVAITKADGGMHKDDTLVSEWSIDLRKPKSTAQGDFIRELLRCPGCGDWSNVVVARDATGFSRIDIFDDGLVQYSGDTWYQPDELGNSAFWCHSCDHEVIVGEEFSIEGDIIG